jgi:hypothetical protein
MKEIQDFIKFEREYIRFLKRAIVIDYILLIMCTLLALTELFTCYVYSQMPLYFTIQGICVMINSWTVYNSIVSILRKKNTITECRYVIEQLKQIKSSNEQLANT